MLIPNLATFTGLDPTTTPAIKSGNLDPSTQWASQELLDMAVGSLYIQKGATLGPNCTVLSSFACLWIKVNRSQDPCNALGSPKDWRRCCCFNLLEGTTPPQPSENPWCAAQTGDWYLQTDVSGCSGLWLKIKDTCGTTDWYNVSGSKCLLTGTTPPDPVALCDYELGAHYLDTSTHCPTLYIKVADNCNAADWLNLSNGCIYDMAGTPVGNVADTNLCELPLGATVRDTTDGNRIYVKVTDNCTGTDYQPVQLRLTTNQEMSGDRVKLDNATQVLNVADPLVGHRRYPYNINGYLVVPQNTLQPVANMNQVYKDNSVGGVICPVGLPDRVVVPFAGYWRVTAAGNFVDGQTNFLAGIVLSYNGGLGNVPVWTAPLQTGVLVAANGAFEFDMNAGDYFVLYAWTNNPGGLLQTGSYDLRLELVTR